MGGGKRTDADAKGEVEEEIRDEEVTEVIMEIGVIEEVYEDIT